MAKIIRSYQITKYFRIIPSFRKADGTDSKFIQSRPAYLILSSILWCSSSNFKKKWVQSKLWVQLSHSIKILCSYLEYCTKNWGSSIQLNIRNSTQRNFFCKYLLSEKHTALLADRRQHYLQNTFDFCLLIIGTLEQGKFIPLEDVLTLISKFFFGGGHFTHIT